MAVNYGQVAIVPKGAWNAETQYKVNNLVSYDGSSYVAKVQPPVGTLPTDTSYWQVSAAGTKKATADSLGTVMPDGTTTSVGEDGKLSVNTAQQDALGVVKGSDDITVGEDGTLTVNTTFEQATELANIIAGEAIKSVLGKVSKAIATTMSLDENALLKNMISGIDVNDSNKVPSSAYIHTLVERIGMGTELVSGLGDLTTGLNTVNNNLSQKLNGRNVKWFPEGESLATIITESVEVSTYGITPKSCPSEIISGGFGYGTLITAGGRGNQGYGYGFAIYAGTNTAGTRVFATYDKDGGWSERVSKSDLNAVLMYRGVITGDLNRGRNLVIAPGIYSIQSVSTITNGPSDFVGWGIFVQFPDNLFSQMILNSPNYIKFRKYAGSNPSWSAW
jgi:hypothetical protein